MINFSFKRNIIPKHQQNHLNLRASFSFPSSHKIVTKKTVLKTDLLFQFDQSVPHD